MHRKPFCQLKFSMPHLTAACFGKSEQKSVHPFVSFGKVQVRSRTFMSIVKKKKQKNNNQTSLNSHFLEGCVSVFRLEIGICVLMLIFSVAVCKHSEYISNGVLKFPVIT